MSKQDIFKQIKPEIKKVFGSSSRLVSKLRSICSILIDNIDYCDWAGFYILEEGMLHLGPFVGSETEHSVIEIGRGICGQVADKKETLIIDDVTKEDNYLSCSIKVKSEIVVPVIVDGKIFGVIDIDSHQKSAFSLEDKAFLEGVAKHISSAVEYKES